MDCKSFAFFMADANNKGSRHLHNYIMCDEIMASTRCLCEELWQQQEAAAR